MATPASGPTSHTLTGLPVRQRGHRHLHPRNPSGTLDATLHVIGDRPLTAGHVSVYAGAFDCALCDAHPGFTYDGSHLVAKTACPLPDGVDITFDLAVTSGRIIVDDDLRPVYDAPLPCSPGYHSAAGQAAYCATMADLGCAYGPVGNTSPSLIRTGPDTYVIAAVDPDAGPGEEGHLAGEVLAGICTDLWAYSMADHDDWVAKGGDPVNLPDTATVVEVPNGTYRFVHHTGRADFDYDAPWPLVFADVTRLPLTPGA